MGNNVRIDRLWVLVIVGVFLWLLGHQDNLTRWLSGLSAQERILFPVIGAFIVYHGVLFLYDTIHWRLLRKEQFFGGIWIYQLEDKTVEQHVYGVFQVNHTSSGISVPRGMAWDCTSEPIPSNVSAAWSSLRTSVHGYHLEVVFDMKSMRAEPETGFMGYQGVISFTATAAGHLSGHFADLGLRRGHFGVVVAERVSGLEFAEAAVEAGRVFAQPSNIIPGFVESPTAEARRRQRA